MGSHVFVSVSVCPFVFACVHKCLRVFVCARKCLHVFARIRKCSRVSVFANSFHFTAMTLSSVFIFY